MFIFAPMKRKQIKNYLLIGFSILVQTVTAQLAPVQHPSNTQTAQQGVAEEGLVKWMTYEEAAEKQKTVPRPIIMDFYTDWCGWCKQMIKTTYSDPNLASYINTYFYPVKFDAEGKDTVEYLGKKYFPTSAAPRTVHPLAAKLLQNKLMYPTTLFLNGFDQTKNEYKLSMLASGYLETTKIEPILIFTLENAFRNSSYDDFNNGYQKAFYDSSTIEKAKLLKWLTPKEVFTADMKLGKKKIIFFGNNDWCNSCKVERRASFADSVNLEYISQKFDMVDFDPNIKDTLFFNKQTLTNPATQQIPYHSLAFTLCHGSLTFPTLVIMNENNEVVDAIPGYINAGFLNQISHFYGDDVYKTKSWQDFTKK